MQDQRAVWVDAEEHSAERLTIFYSVNSYRLENFTWPSDYLKNNIQGASLNRFPWPNSYIQALNHRVGCKTLDAVGKSHNTTME